MTATQKLLYTTAELVEATGLSKSKIDEEVREGRLKVRRTAVNDRGEPAGKRAFLATDVHAWLNAFLPG